MPPKRPGPRSRSRAPTPATRARGDPDARRRMQAVGGALEAFRRASGILHRVTRHASGERYGLADALLLHAIGLGEVQTPGEIAGFTGLTSGSVTSLLDRLEAAGYVRRERSTTDRRMVLVRLTPKARESLSATMERAHREIDRIFASWPTREIETLARLLATISSPAMGPEGSRHR